MERSFGEYITCSVFDYHFYRTRVSGDLHFIWKLIVLERNLLKQLGLNEGVNLDGRDICQMKTKMI